MRPARSQYNIEMRPLFLLAFLPLAATADDTVLARVAAHSERFGAISRQIWESPELGFHELKSSALLRDELRTNGFTIADAVAGMPTAFTASWGSGKPVIGILGEFDALPGLSQKDSPTQDPVAAGAPGCCTVRLLRTVLTPVTLPASSEAKTFAASLVTKPLRVTTPFETVTMTRIP